MVSVVPNITVHTISEGYLVIGHSLIERVTILLYLAVYWTQLIPTCKTLQINVNSSGFLHIYTRKVLQPHSKHYHQHPIYFPLCNHTWSHFGLRQSQVNALCPIWYLHQNNVDPSRFLHQYTRNVHLPHSKHYHRHPIYFPLCNHTWSHFGLRQSQVNTLCPIWYLHQNNVDPSRFLHQYTRKVHLPHSKHYYRHPIYFPLCNTDLQVRMISITCALVRLYLGTSYHAKHRSPTTPQIDALTRRRHPAFPAPYSWDVMTTRVTSCQSN